MEVTSIDHVNLRIPDDGSDDAVDFYRNRLGFDIEGMERYRSGDQSFFDVRLAPAHVIHLWPTAEFEPPSGDNFNHVALLVDVDVESLKEQLADIGVSIDMELDAPLGATGRAPAVYVTDPFGYQIELKTAAE
ncbi:MAG: catechol 2,3-dioxygenase-like lactoylglutathione lyase family enzyme [Natronomonas sp.]|jgi:catechol 2,3-dioxygenase-like lactoylglutathione lyase family enzyme|uniref:VOC family protein n=1 Tax=Natronomonas sp. TaxID=2184060 RepID=UPI003988DF3F